MLRRWYWRVVVGLTTDRRDRGEGPVPYIIMVALMAIAAAAIAGIIRGVADGWISKIPR